jgi:succinate dehydrogenase / fumarate reductase, cytochrome b subunit
MSDAAVKGESAGAARPKARPKYLNLFELGLSQPVPAVVSILHRISGAGLFIALLWLLWMLDRSLSSEAAFGKIRHYAGLWPVKLALLGVAWAYCHHFCAGIRYLFLDLDKGIDLATARLTSFITLAASLLLTAVIAWKLW